MSKTRRNGRGSSTRGWKHLRPGYHERTVMLKRCGKKCFLGPKKSFPICKKNTCKVSVKGLHAAYIRARQYKHQNISRKARKMIQSL